MSPAHLKVVADPLRGELRDAIAEVVAAESAAAKASEGVELASERVRAARLAHSKAENTLSEAIGPPLTLQDKLREALDVDDQIAIAEEHYKAPPRAPVTASDLARLRAAILSAGGDVIVAESALEAARAHAAPMISAVNRAKDRRQKAICAVVQSEVGRLLQTAEELTKALGEARSSLKCVAGLVDPYSDARRVIDRHLNQGAPELFPREFGLRAAPSAAWAAWEAFAEAIKNDAEAAFPEAH